MDTYRKIRLIGWVRIAFKIVSSIDIFVLVVCDGKRYFWAQ